MLAFTSAVITSLHDRTTDLWHRAEPSDEPVADVPVMEIVARQHLRNFRLWHVEDQARRRDVDDSYIAAQKRAIDKLNQSRQDFIERIDESFIELWPWVMEDGLPMNTETPGSVIDRLSIASLKLYHMNEEAHRVDVDDAHRKKCAERVEILMRQRRDLAAALDILFDDLVNRRKRLQVYRQFKMYNDPALNPAVYKPALR